MSLQLNHGIPSERRSLRMIGTGANPNGTTNDAVIAWTGLPASLTTFGPYPLANWVGVTNDAVFGTTFKFVKRGAYHVRVYIPQLASSTILAGISLDSPAPQLIGNPTPQTMLHMAQATLPAATTLGLQLSAVVNITDAMAGGPGPLPVGGATGVGVVRIHGTDGAEGPIGSALTTDADITIWIDYLHDLAGG